MSLILWKGAARAALALGLAAAALPASAQFPTSLGQGGTGERVVDKSGKVSVIQEGRTYLSVSPLTVFQFTDTSPAGNGDFATRKRNNFGPFVQLEKHFPLRPNPGNQPSSFVLGAWYWGHTSDKNNNPDRLGIYGQYNINQNFSAQATVGGATRGQQSGLFEYYGFLLYQPTLPKKSNLGLQVGVGPYFVRHSIGDTGYTYTAGAVYRLTPRYSLSASYWKVNYNKPPGSFGTGIHNDLARTNLSLVYNFK